jgi:dihydropyrimidinase
VTYHAGVVERGLPPTWFARVLAENPARLFGLYPRKGTIQPGADADLLIYDPDAEWEIRAADHVGLAGYTPYEGRRVLGRAWMTLLRGEVLLSDEAVQAKPGSGRLLEAGSPQPPLGGRVTGGVAAMARKGARDA